ncbi:MAG: integrase core domain-containing protein, partial [Desulforhopalus sp.]
IYLKAYETGWELEEGIADFVQRYNQSRPHQSLGYATPDEVYDERVEIAVCSRRQLPRGGAACPNPRL